MGIIYRNFQPGDEYQIAEVFNICFHLSGSGFARTPKSILWRYIYRPDALTGEVQLAIDDEKKLIVGTVFSTIEHIWIDGIKFKTGSINDVAVLPQYGGKSIAKNLLLNAISFLESENCDISSLSADPKGHARNKIYLPLGWNDFTALIMQIKPLIHYYFKSAIFPLLIPIYIIDKAFSLWKNAKRRKKYQENVLQHYIYQPNLDQRKRKILTNSLLMTFNHNAPLKRNGKVHYSKKEWDYFRVNGYYQGVHPTFIIFVQNHKIIAFSSFLRQWMYFEKYGLRFPLAIIRDCVISPDFIKIFETEELAFSYLIDETVSAAKDRSCAALLYTSSLENQSRVRVFKKKRFLPMKGGVLMLKNINRKVSTPYKSKKPFNPDIGELFLYP